MKEFIIIASLTFIATACASYKSLDLRKLTTGMSKAQVESVAGLPQRVLAVNETKDGYQEVLEYRTSQNEVYALEFWNDYLTGYEYLYDDVTYIPAPAPPPYYYDYFGRPVMVIPGRPARPIRPMRPNRPSQPSRPNQPSRPTPPSTGTVRPPSSGNRPPATEQPTTRPAEGSRPVGTTPPTIQRPSVRPAESSSPATSRPSTRESVRDE